MGGFPGHPQAPLATRAQRPGAPPSTASQELKSTNLSPYPTPMYPPELSPWIPTLPSP